MVYIYSVKADLHTASMYTISVFLYFYNNYVVNNP